MKAINFTCYLLETKNNIYMINQMTHPTTFTAASNPSAFSTSKEIGTTQTSLVWQSIT
jgi:hypothetical protein